MNTQQSSFLALSQSFLLEFVNVNYGILTQDAALHLHEIPNDNAIQVLNGDIDQKDTNNTRLYSFYADNLSTNDNVLTDPTPFSYTDIDSAAHQNSEKLGITNQIPYKIVRLYVRAGYQFGANDAGLALKLSAKYNQREIRLLNFFLPSNQTLFNVATNNVYINNVLYNSYIEFKILDMSIFASTKDAQLIPIAEELFGLGAGNISNFNAALLSDYKAEFSVINNANVSTFQASGANTNSVSYTFTKFTTNSWSTNVQFLSDRLAQISSFVQRTNRVLEVGVQASGALSIQQQLLQITSDLNQISITHHIQLDEIDISSQNIGSSRFVLSNEDSQWGISRFIPIIQQQTNTIRLLVRTRIQSFDKGQDISKFSELLLLQADVNKLRQSNAGVTVSVNTQKVTNTITQQITQISGATSGSKTVNLKSNTIYVHYTSLSVTINNVSSQYKATENKQIQLFNETSAYSFDFSVSGVIQALPQSKLHFTDELGKVKVFENTRTSNKVVFELNRSMFTTERIRLRDDKLRVIAEFIVLS